MMGNESVLKVNVSESPKSQPNRQYGGPNRKGIMQKISESMAFDLLQVGQLLGSTQKEPEKGTVEVQQWNSRLTMAAMSCLPPMSCRSSSGDCNMHECYWPSQIIILTSI